MRPRLATHAILEGILSGNRVILAQAITLVESDLPDDQQRREELLDLILPHTGKAFRVGITGVPGVGKSTFIEAFGNHLIETGKSVAVLTVDPSSTRTKGSILGDKTRMETLSKNEKAFIRPTASAGVYGGTAARTREALLLCEAAGFQVIIVETVGVGQSETQVSNLVDFFILLLLAGAGDELQGMKKGIVEMADALFITKADGDNVARAQAAMADYRHAIHLLPPRPDRWVPQVLTCSAFDRSSMAAAARVMKDYEQHARERGSFGRRRERQKAHWLKAYFGELLQDELYRSPALVRSMETLERQVMDNHLSVTSAARQMLELYRQAVRGETGKTQ